ncbi:hypothetical protein PVOR_07200 [Paenibacillus vortex V453]|uniref:Uncharacterized protein n=1 Tax=Paenibacillus vortex V453 TaxID=715225 RepID=A0A2R9SZ44_9BACL|nr:hypothetical protein PVOR_07200 [Paenibacillus vortex V453]
MYEISRCSEIVLTQYQGSAASGLFWNVHNFVIFITYIVNIFTYNKDIEKVITSRQQEPTTWTSKTQQLSKNQKLT